MSSVTIDSVLPGIEARSRLADAFRRAVGATRSPAKELARKVGRSPKGAELLLRGEVSPSLETLVAACQAYDEVWTEFKALCGRANDASEAEMLLSEFAQKLKERMNQ